MYCAFAAGGVCAHKKGVLPQKVDERARHENSLAGWQLCHGRVVYRECRVGRQVRHRRDQLQDDVGHTQSCARGVSKRHRQDVGKHLPGRPALGRTVLSPVLRAGEAEWQVALRCGHLRGGSAQLCGAAAVAAWSACRTQTTACRCVSKRRGNAPIHTARTSTCRTPRAGTSRSCRHDARRRGQPRRRTPSLQASPARASRAWRCASPRASGGAKQRQRRRRRAAHLLRSVDSSAVSRGKSHGSVSSSSSRPRSAGTKCLKHRRLPNRNRSS